MKKPEAASKNKKKTFISKSRENISAKGSDVIEQERAQARARRPVLKVGPVLHSPKGLKRI